jgi:aspartyl/asparaginyl-tRNA synthetase
MFCLRHRVRYASRHVQISRRTIRLYSENKSRRLVDVLENDRDEAAVTVHGFVQSVRKQKKIAFAALSDGSSLEPLQAVLQPEQAEKYLTIDRVSSEQQC